VTPHTSGWFVVHCFFFFFFEIDLFAPLGTEPYVALRVYVYTFWCVC
jgi:hypothetical protein